MERPRKLNHINNFQPNGFNDLSYISMLEEYIDYLEMKLGMEVELRNFEYNSEGTETVQTAYNRKISQHNLNIKNQ